MRRIFVFAAAAHAAKILFIHQSFPGQFATLLRLFVASGRHQLVALLPTTAPNRDHLPRNVTYSWYTPRAPIHGDSSLGGFERKMHTGRDAAVQAARLRNGGYKPDVIVAHPMWGEAMLLHAVWPRTPQLHFVEWFYGQRGTDFDFVDAPGAARRKWGDDDGKLTVAEFHASMHAEVGNAALTLSFSRMALGVTPTRFQWGVIPPFARAKTVVQFDGIDTDYFTADANAVLQLPSGVVLRAGDEVVTFANRVFEPARGIHRFVEALPRVLAARPNAHVVLIGLDRPQVRYGAGRNDGRGWLTALKANHTDVDWSRVHEVGKVARKGMRQIFRVSAVHVLLTQPFFLSWSFLEAMATECLVVGSDTAPVQEVVRDGHNGYLVPFADAAAIAARIVDALEMRVSPLHTRMRRAARALVVERYAASSLWRARAALVEGLAGGATAVATAYCLHVRPDLAAAAAAALPPATDCSPGGGDAATDAEDDLEINACLAKVYSESFPGGPPPLEGDDDPRLSSNR